METVHVELEPPPQKKKKNPENIAKVEENSDNRPDNKLENNSFCLEMAEFLDGLKSLHFVQHLFICFYPRVFTHFPAYSATIE